MVEIVDINIGGQNEEGNYTVGVELLYQERAENGETYEYTDYESMKIPQSELQYLADQMTNILNRETLSIDGKTKLTEVRKDGSATKLFIEPYTFPDTVDLSKECSVVTDSYELGINAEGSQNIYYDLTHNISDVKGSAFRLVSEQETVDLSYVCRITDWQYDDAGELDNINVPDVPYDHGHYEIPTGDYRVWEEN